MNYEISTDGIRTKAVNESTGSVDYIGNDASKVIQGAIGALPGATLPNSGGKIYISDGKYSILSGINFGQIKGTDFSNLRNDIVLELSPNAILEVPNGYTGYVFGFGDYNNNITVTGGKIEEALQPGLLPQRKWRAFDLVATNNGIYFNIIKDIYIRDPDIAINFQSNGDGTSNNGWINGNSFQNIKIYNPNIFIDFNMAFPPGGANGFGSNYFMNIMGQASTNVLYGARNIRHNRNIFIDVKFWDLQNNPAAISSNIHADASDTIIIGGIMTNQNFSDNGANTKIISQWNSKGIKPANILRGLTPIASGWGIAPTNLGNTTNGNPNTSTGIGTTVRTNAGDYGYLIFDLGEVKTIVLGAKVGLWSTAGQCQLIFDGSDDNLNWIFGGNSVVSLTSTIEGVRESLSCSMSHRFVRLRFFVTAPSTANAKIYQVYGNESN